MTPPADVFDALDLTVDPQLVHHLAHAFDARIAQERAKVLRCVQSFRLHAVEDETGVFAQRVHRDVPRFAVPRH